MIVVIVKTTDRARIAEALRAALGLTLRGDHVRAFCATLPEEARRAADTLRSFGHEVIEHAPDAAIDAAIREARGVEVWT
ncbi:MAG TPA: hypothetical protein VL463_17025 [Kofleriaceae bacterium]|nr:hypothetical protein [Kofleriaceae bacterium]